MATIDDVYTLLQTVDGKVDQLIAAVITNAAGADIAADIIAMQGNVTDILTDTGTTLDGKVDSLVAACITNAVGTDVSADLLTVMNKTNNLPSDPADESAIEAAITAAADAVRGVDSDTLKTISDQIDGVATAGNVWDEAQASHVAAGSMGAFVANVKSQYGI